MANQHPMADAGRENVGADEWSDLQVITPTTSFHVPKHVVCYQSLTIRDIVNEHYLPDGKVWLPVPENARTMEALLQHMYRVYIPLLCPENIDRLQTTDAVVKRMRDIMELYKAMQKYHVETLKSQLSDAREKCLFADLSGTADCLMVVTVGQTFFGVREDVPHLARRATSIVARRLRDIIADDVAWATLRADQEFATAVVVQEVNDREYEYYACADHSA